MCVLLTVGIPTKGDYLFCCHFQALFKSEKVKGIEGTNAEEASVLELKSFHNELPANKSYNPAGFHI